MKILVLVLSLITTTSFGANIVGNYDELLSRQVTVEVTNISTKDRAIYTGGGTGAAAVCASLGFIRVVEAKSIPCTRGETLYFRSSFAGAVSELVSNEAGSVVCGQMGIRDKLESVVCAK